MRDSFVTENAPKPKAISNRFKISKFRKVASRTDHKRHSVNLKS